MPVDDYCIGCIYRTQISTGPCCSYCDVQKHSRGCPAGNGCNQRKLKDGYKSTTRMTHHEKGALASAESRARVARQKESPSGGATKSAINRTEYERQRQQKMFERNQEALGGKQREAIIAYKKSHGLSNRQLARKLGVPESRVAKWVSEYYRADWDLLESIGIEKPEGVD